jgi:hypothetical protein
MSIAGVQSSRGDAYQTLIAADWVIRSLYDPIEWLELDSTSLDPSGNLISIDDVVIAFADKRTLYCQCKKNSPTHDKWTPSGLRDELKKAGLQLARDPAGHVRFYSRSNFGDLSRLTEHARTHPDNAAFLQDLPESLKDAYATFQLCWAPVLAQPGNTVYGFLKRLEFEVTSDFADLRARQLGHLRQLVSQHERVYDAIMTRLELIGRRMNPIGAPSSNSIAERLTRGSLRDLIAAAGSVQTPTRTEAELDARLRQLSKLGRAWIRTVDGTQIPRATLRQDLMHILASQPATLLLHAGPGFGKSCILLDLTEALEASPRHFALYLQGRLFASSNSDADRVALGLDEDMVGLVARAAEFRHCVVIIDSLDALSLNREHAALGYFLSLIDRLSAVRNVTVVAACRTFDLEYDTQLSPRDWIKKLAIGALDWDIEVVPLLQRWQVDPERLSAKLRELLRNPRMLSLFAAVSARGLTPGADSEQELTEQYLEVAVARAPELGEPALEHLSRLAAQMIVERRLDIPRARAGLPQSITSTLLSAAILIESAPGRLALAHQTLLDVLAVRRAQRNGDSLLQFVSKQPQTPFIRPTVRTFFFYLRTADPGQFRKQVRATLDSPGIAYQLKRLLVESLAELAAAAEDWPLINHLIRAHPSLFDSFFGRIRTPDWFALLQQHWLPELQAHQDASRLLFYAQRISILAPQDPAQAIALWQLAISLPWIDREELRRVIAFGSRDLTTWTTPGAQQLVEWLVNTAPDDHDFASAALCRFVEATDSNDFLLWRYITSATDKEDPAQYHFGDKLRCGPNHAPMPEFLPKRMIRSNALLEFAVGAVSSWADRRRRERSRDHAWDDRFLGATSYAQRHSHQATHYIEPSSVLFGAIETACLERAASLSRWWIDNEVRLRQSADGALRYIALRAYTNYPESNRSAIAAVLRDEDIVGAPGLRYEVNELIRASFTLLSQSDQEALEIHALSVGGAYLHLAEDVGKWRRDRLAAIPAFLRSPTAQQYLDQARRQFGDAEHRPAIPSFSGFVSSPVSDSELLSLSDRALLKLINYLRPARRDEADGRWLDLDQVSSQLTLAASRDAERFLKLLRTEWFEIPPSYRRSILDGVTNHLRFRFGNLRSSAPWEPVAQPDGAGLASQLLTELEAHGAVWRGTLAASQALSACAHILDVAADNERFAFLLIGTWRSTEPPPNTHADDLLASALNSARGVAAEAAAILARRIGESGAPLNDLLRSSLTEFAQDESEAVRALLIHYLPAVQRDFPDFGWSLFTRAIEQASPSLWNQAEPCLYYAYRRDFARIEPFLRAAEAQVATGTGAMWGRIASLAMLAGYLSLEQLLATLRLLGNAEAWRGTASVFATNAPQPELKDQCLAGLRIVLDDPLGQGMAVQEMTSLFRGVRANEIPCEVLARYFEVLGSSEHGHSPSLYEFQKWLAQRVQVAPEEALSAAELALRKGPPGALHVWDQELYPKILTSLFRETEDREEQDGGVFLRRVIALQDALIKLGSTQIYSWLTAAERP